MTITERLSYIKNLQNDECWYITKHNLDFKQLCFSAQIAEEYQNSDQTLNFEQFYNSRANNYGVTPNHRATNNCYYVGLLLNRGGYKDAVPTEFYFQLKNSVHGDFNALDVKNELVVSQLEKVFLTNPTDREFDGLRKDLKIHPAFFLAKVLLSIGEITGKYFISLEEFYVFIGTATEYKNHYIVTQMIIENRKYNFKLDKTKFTNNRVHLLLDNLPYFIKRDGGISLDEPFINTLREKLVFYENSTESKLFSEEQLTNKINLQNLYPQIFKEQNSLAINKIFYGAPGTGKSHKVKSLVNCKDSRMQRVTFHPEFDYATFVGGYKPTMANEDGKEVIKYKFVPQAFTNTYVKAWNDPEQDYYLVIEEINRGNCAEIFGDIFQLLDRGSDYDITPSLELETYLKSELMDKNKGLENGKLKLPKNLTIYATMNTSDQSLYPMDSAFKRRWDWEYIPICYEAVNDEGEPNPSYNYIIDLGNGTSFRWNEFISKINLNHIQQNPVLGMDKCIGNYFVIPKNGETTIDV